ncbi:MAG: endonuclease/exonuclease/phosphatase family protein [Brevundimonas sp.]|uniref:endonuclease/exonuclease/phosphatase family protein n=1 Tax=Brevundimonas sp. TaxID=1871086 RepID=UPI0017B72F8D|nr:endonuclease/exonuclease/phosphatase family protein [Brevundimonas sp.]MBA4804988.1 endonuclease/exonuclease/phosphatase family protein [Brevundimonas sp.]
MTTGVHPWRKPLRRAFRRAVRLAALAAVGGLALTAVAALAGVGHRAPDLLAQFAAPAFVGALVLLAALVLLRRRRLAGGAAAATAALLLAVWPQWFPPQGEPGPGAPGVRIYAANLWARNRDVDAIAASIRAADADILVLIEVGDAPAARLDAILAGYPHRVASRRIERSSGAARSVIAARWPLAPIPDRPDGLHALGAIAETPLGPVNVVGVHLTRPWPFQEQWGQISQTMALADLRRSLRGPVVVAGDFNSVSTARIGRQMKAQTGLVPASGWPGSWPAAAPAPLRINIDQVWRSPDLALTRRRLGAPTGSDHRPVVVEITPAAG